MVTKEVYDTFRNEVRKTIGRVIKRKRHRINMSQQTLADILGVTKSSVSRYESGKTEIPASALPVISDCCRFPMNDFTDAIESEKYMELLAAYKDYNIAFDYKEAKFADDSSDKKKRPVAKNIIYWYGQHRNQQTISFEDLETYNMGIRVHPKFFGSDGAYLRTMAVAYKCWKEDGYNKDECSTCRKNGMFCEKFEKAIEYKK